MYILIYHVCASCWFAIEIMVAMEPDASEPSAPSAGMAPASLIMNTIIILIRIRLMIIILIIIIIIIIIIIVVVVVVVVVAVVVVVVAVAVVVVVVVVVAVVAVVVVVVVEVAPASRCWKKLPMNSLAWALGFRQNVEFARL